MSLMEDMIEDTQRRLVDAYDAGTVIAYRYGPNRAITRLGGAVIIVQPWPWEADPASHLYEEPPALAVGSIEQLLQPSECKERALTRLGHLLCWASARTGWLTRVLVDENGNPEQHRYRTPLDPQRCAGGIFNRLLVREVLQAFLDAGHGTDAEVGVGFIPEHGPGRVLALRCGEVSALVMSMREDTEPGTSPMPVEWGAAQ
jgi:hypothetical protein